MSEITTLLAIRVPQPGCEEEDYGVPSVLMPAVLALYRARNVCPDPEVAVIDRALLRLLGPWIRG